MRFNQLFLSVVVDNVMTQVFRGTFVAATLILCSCTGSRVAIKPPPTYVIPPTASSLLSTSKINEITNHSNQSWFYPIENGLDAFAARGTLARAALKSLDLQYYIFEGDLSGMLLLSVLFEAADRGVRVRLLVDGFEMAGKEVRLSALAAHPNIEIRLFNPLYKAGVARIGEAVTDFARLNRRMHNKLFIADNQIIIFGGRNIGNSYFDADPDMSFRDLDMLAVGPVVQELSASFDLYWNSDYSTLLKPDKDEANRQNQTEQVRSHFKSFVQENKTSSYIQALRKTEIIQQLMNNSLKGVWGQTTVLMDDPIKISGRPTINDLLVGQMEKKVSLAKKEFFLVSPYMIPGEKFIESLSTMTARGVDVRLLTNSLSSTDAGPVYMKYKAYQKRILATGARLFEIKAKPGAKNNKWGAGSSRSGLHAKNFVIDGERVFVGSFNLDPRSINLNTEVGVLIESPELAQNIRDLFLMATHPENSYELKLTEKKDVHWYTGAEGERPIKKIPEVSWFRRTWIRFVSFFIPEAWL